MGYGEYRRVILTGSIPEEHIERMRKLAVCMSPEWKEKPIFSLFIASRYEDTDWIKGTINHFTGVGKVFEGKEGILEIQRELERIVKEFPGTIFHRKQ